MAGRMAVKGTVFNTNNNATDLEGYAIPPIADNLGIGQIAVNTSETDPCVFFKTSAGKLVKIVSEEKLTKTLTDILGNSAADLDTLRELIAQFEGSANDILPLLTDLKRRVEEAEGELATKADKSALNSHIGNTSNPHNVTKAQVGLSNVRNVEQLGINENAVSSTTAKYHTLIELNGVTGQTVEQVKSRLLEIIRQNADKGPFVINIQGSGNDLVLNWANDTHKLASGNPKTSFEVTNALSASSRLYAFIKITTCNDKFFFTTAIIDNTWQPMRKVFYHGDTAADSSKLGGIVAANYYHTGNSNKLDVDWTCRNLVVDGCIKRQKNHASILFNATDETDNWDYAMTSTSFYSKSGDTLDLGSTTNRWRGTYTNTVDALVKGEFGTENNAYSRITENAHWFIEKSRGDMVCGLTYNGSNNPEWHIGGSGVYSIWHSGNSNKADVDWNANNSISHKVTVAGDGVSGDDSSPHWRIIEFNSYDNSRSLFKIKVGDQSTSRHAGSFVIDQMEDNDSNKQVSRFAIMHNGNVGIGETLPANKLTVLGDNDDGTPIAGVYNSSPYSVPQEKSIGAAFTLGKKDVSGFQQMATIYGAPHSNSSSTAGYFSVSVRNGGSMYERFRIDKDGKVGIGTINPTEKLDVNGNIKGSEHLILTNTSGYRRIIIGNKDSSGANKPNIIHSENAYLSFGYGDSWSVSDGGNMTTVFKISHDKQSRFYGNVGIKVEVPTEALHVDGNILANKVKILSTDIEGCIQFGENADGTDLGVISGRNATNMAKLAVLADLSDFGGSGSFKGNVTAKGDIVALKTEAMVFTASEYAAGATKLNDLVDVKIPENLSAKMVLAYDPAQINPDGTKGGYTFMPSAGTGTGSVSASEITSLPEHNHNDIVYASDIRLKEDIVPLRNATIMLNNLRPKEYSWNEEGRRLGLRDPKAYGLIAQEVEGLRDIIDLVKPLHGGESGYLGVDYVKLVPVLVAGFQEQCAEIIESKNLIKSVRLSANKAYSKEVENSRKIEYLENRIVELENLLSKK